MNNYENTIANLQAVIDAYREYGIKLQAELELTRDLARKLAYTAIGNAETEAELGCVTGSTYDSMLDIYEAFIGDDEVQQDCLLARKAMRQNEWGIEFHATEYDLPLDDSWQEHYEELLADKEVGA